MNSTRSSLANMFAMEGLERELFRAIAQHDLARGTEGRLMAKRRVELLKRTLESQRGGSWGNSHQIIVAFKIYCAIGSMPGVAIASLAKRILPHMPKETIEQGLNTLLANALISKEASGYKINDDLVVYRNEADQRESHIDFIRASLNAAHDSVPRWFAKPELAHLQSMTFGISEQRLKTFLPKLRALMSELHDELAHDPGDVLIHFNVQLFPTANSRLNS